MAKQLENRHKEKSQVMDTYRFEEVGLPSAQHSIFYNLYHYTDEVGIKLILLKELMTIGDEKELPFLKSLLDEKEKAITKIVEEAIEIIQKKGMKKPKHFKKSNHKEEHPSNLFESEIEPNTFSSKDDRIPMELFLLYEELGIESCKDNEDGPSPFDFELSPEFFVRNDSQHEFKRK